MDVKGKARELGFDLCGVARAHRVDPRFLDHWFDQGWHADLQYVRDRRDERLDPSLLVPDARSVIVVGASYYSADSTPDGMVVARYARGRDYHNVVLKPVRKLAAWMRSLGARVYAEVDTGAVMERYWAQEAGLGWVGKNGCLINPEYGSWILLGALITDAELPADPKHPDRCGECTACIPACPTQAIPEPRFVDARRCVAYHTIEHRGPIPPELAVPERLFGCDICQDVCPWNRKAVPGGLVQLRARPEQSALRLDDVLSLTDEAARARFNGTPLMRAGRDGLVRTALAIAPRTPALREAAQRLRDDPADGVRAEARRVLSETET